MGIGYSAFSNGETEKDMRSFLKYSLHLLWTQYIDDNMKNVCVPRGGANLSKMWRGYTEITSGWRPDMIPIWFLVDDNTCVTVQT